MTWVSFSRMVAGVRRGRAPKWGKGTGFDHWDWSGLHHWGLHDCGGSGNGWQGSWGGSVWQVVWVVVVVVVVEPVVQVVVWVEDVWVVVVVAIEVGSLGFGLSFSLGSGLTLGQSVGAESQSSTTAGSDTVVSSVWEELGNDGRGSWGGNGWGHQRCRGGSDKGWGWDGCWSNHLLVGDFSWDGLDSG